MARIKGPRKVHRYSAEFKLKAVKLSALAGVMVQDVAEALDIHPFMLSRWRKEAREDPAAFIAGLSLAHHLRTHRRMKHYLTECQRNGVNIPRFARS